MQWDELFFNLCYEIAKKSKDRSTKVGCVIVGSDNEILSMGFNGFPRGVDDTVEARHSRENGIKYRYTEHSERNAIYNAAKNGIPLKGCRIYVPWHPCTDCARGIIQSGLVEVVLDGDYKMDDGLIARWEEDRKIAEAMFMEAGVSVRKFTRGDN